MLRSYHRPFDSTRFCASYHRLSGLIEENEELKDETSAEWKRWKDFNKSAGYALLNHAPKWEYRIEPGKYAGELHIKNTENKINIFYDLLKNGDVEFSEVLFKTDAVIRSSEFKTAGYFGFSDGTGFVAVTEEKDIEGLSLIDVNSLDRFGEYISQAGTQLRLRLIIFFANQTPFAQGWKELDDNILGSASPAHHTGSINNNNIKFSQKKGMCSVYFIIHKHFQGPPASYEFHNHLYQNPEQYLEQFGVRLH